MYMYMYIYSYPSHTSHTCTSTCGCGHSRLILKSLSHIPILSSQDKIIMDTYIQPFLQILQDHTLPLLSSFVTTASKEEDPVNFVYNKRGVIDNFLISGLPVHIALSVCGVVSIK